MSYCRWDEDSDVYVYLSDKGYICHIKGGHDIVCKFPEEMADELVELRNNGFAVPDFAIESLREEE